MNYPGMSLLQALRCNGSTRVLSVLQMHQLNVEVLARISLELVAVCDTEHRAQTRGSSDAVRPVLLNAL